MGERPVCRKGGINVKENCSMKDGAALAAPSFLCFSASSGVTDKSGYLTCSYKYREKISAPPITMISGSINSRHSNSPAE